MNAPDDTRPLAWPLEAARLPAAVRSSLAWALWELPRRHAESGLEQMLVIDAADGGLLLLVEGTPTGVRIPDAEARRVARGRTDRSLVAVHTHAHDGGFSARDFALFADEGRWAASVLCNAENRSTCWLFRQEASPGTPAGFRYDGRRFADLQGSLRRAAREEGMPVRRRGRALRLRPPDRRKLISVLDAAARDFTGDLERHHGAGFRYAAVRDCLEKTGAGQDIWCEMEPLGTRRPYAAICHNAARRALRPAALALLPCVAVPPLLGAFPETAAAAPAAEGFLSAGLLLLFLAALPTPLRRHLGRRVLESVRQAGVREEETWPR